MRLHQEWGCLGHKNQTPQWKSNPPNQPTYKQKNISQIGEMHFLYLSSWKQTFHLFWLFLGGGGLFFFIDASQALGTRTELDPTNIGRMEYIFQSAPLSGRGSTGASYLIHLDWDQDSPPCSDIELRASLKNSSAGCMSAPRASISRADPYFLLLDAPD